ncbi:MAG: CoA transferase [Gammaproteobacteria bacterium]|nr:CoA transferase [Gammaproteobacteria bacterium]
MGAEPSGGDAPHTAGGLDARLANHPLSGVKVVDLGQIYNGPYAGFLLAMGGADVIKVEPPDGEPLRERGGLAGISFALGMLNSNKRGIAINLKSAEGRALLIELVSKADVLLENFAPGALDRLGVGEQVLRAANPRLIYASSTGYGQSGPARDNLAMDLTIQAYAGIMSINGTTDMPPLKAGLALCDFLGAIHLYAGIVTALYERERTGLGRTVEISMMEAAYPALATNLASMYLHAGQAPPRTGNRHPAGTSAPYGVYRCSDGHVAIICVREVHWERLLEVMQQTRLRDDQRFADQATRARNVELVDRTVEQWTSGLSKIEVGRRLREAGVPAAPIRTLPEVQADEHMHLRGMLQHVHHPELGEVVLPHSPLRFHGEQRIALEPSPTLGQHGRVILRDWLGYDDKRVDDLQRASAINIPPDHA